MGLRQPQRSEHFEGLCIVCAPKHAQNLIALCCLWPKLQHLGVCQLYRPPAASERGAASRAWMPLRASLPADPRPSAVIECRSTVIPDLPSLVVDVAVFVFCAQFGWMLLPLHDSNINTKAFNHCFQRAKKWFYRLSGFRFQRSGKEGG